MVQKKAKKFWTENTCFSGGGVLPLPLNGKKLLSSIGRFPLVVVRNDQKTISKHTKRRLLMIEPVYCGSSSRLEVAFFGTPCTIVHLALQNQSKRNHSFMG